MTQKEALDILKMGHNVYLTGPAGSGKTHLLNSYINYLRDHHVDVGVTASTGIASTHLNGTTIHAWSGIGIRDRLSEHDLEAMEEKSYLWKRFERVKVLIIDEVSMLHHFRLDLVDRVLRFFKRNEEPFGGIQVVLCGDFFQLPPVSRSGDSPAQFIFKALSWKALDLKVCYLHEQHRQTEDGLLSILNAIRKNDIDEDIMERLKTRYNKEPVIKLKDIRPTKLYTHNSNVDEINLEHLRALPAEAHTFRMTEKGRGPLLEVLKKSCLAPEHIILKTGAQVMFIKNNFDAGYVNGTLGKVVAFDDEGPIVETLSGQHINVKAESWRVEEEGKVKAEISQIPIRLAWAITVHKSQGMSLDAVEVDLSKSFEQGMGYVALSRVRTIDGLKLLGLNNIALQVNPEILEFDYALLSQSKDAVSYLDQFSRQEIEEMQEGYLASIAPKGDEKKKKLPAYKETLALIAQKVSLKEIAEGRKVKVETIIGHLEQAIEEGEKPDIKHLEKEISTDVFKKIKALFEEMVRDDEPLRLSPVKSKLGSKASFADIRLVRLFMLK
jgi:ATP-dependent DNA helicase PIF1